MENYAQNKCQAAVSQFASHSQLQHKHSSTSSLMQEEVQPAENEFEKDLETYIKSGKPGKHSKLRASPRELPLSDLKKAIERSATGSHKSS